MAYDCRVALGIVWILRAVIVTHGVGVVAVNLPDSVGGIHELMTGEKATKKPRGRLKKISYPAMSAVVVANDTVALAPVTPGKGLSICSEVVVVVVPVAYSMLAYGLRIDGFEIAAPPALM